MLAAGLLLAVAPAPSALAPRVSLVSFTPAWPKISYCEGSAWQCDSDDPALVLDVVANDPVPPEDPVTISMRIWHLTYAGGLSTPTANDRTRGSLTLPPGRHTVRLSDFTGGPRCHMPTGVYCPLTYTGPHLLELAPSRPPGNGTDRVGIPRHRWFFVTAQTIPRG